MNMLIKQNFFDALKNIIAHKLRSILALLGILIGTASLVSMLILGNLATHAVIEQFNQLGSDILYINVSTPPYHTNPLTLSHISNMLHTNTHIKSIVPIANIAATPRWRGHTLQGDVTATTPNMQKISQLHVSQGRFLSYLDRPSHDCVIGADIASQLKHLGKIDYLGNRLSINNTYFTIVGVLSTQPSKLFLPIDFNKSIFTGLPPTNHGKNSTSIRGMVITTTPHHLKQVKSNLNTRLHLWLGPSVHISFFSPEELIRAIQAQQKNLNLLLALIGTITLIVGGIGIMNVLLVCVMERKREIGIRLAVGATRAHIRLMFLIEALTFSIIGGLLGILLSILVTYGICYFTKWSYYIPLSPIILGCLIAGITGILFGYYPAHRASKLQPIDALR